MITVLLVISILANVVLVGVMLKQLRDNQAKEDTVALKAKEEAEAKQKAYVEGLLKKIDDLEVQVNHVESCIAERDATIARLNDSMTKGAKLEEGLKNVGDAISPKGLGKGIGSFIKGIKSVVPAITGGFKDGYQQAIK